MSTYRRKNHDFNARLQSLHDELQRKTAAHAEHGRVIVADSSELTLEFADPGVVGVVGGATRTPPCGGGTDQIVVAPHDFEIDARFKNERDCMLDRMDLD